MCSERNVELVKSLGATEVVDYTKTTLAESLTVGGVVTEEKKFDLIYDCATNSGGGENYYTISKGLLKSTAERHGQYVAISGSAGLILRAMTGFGRRANEHFFISENNTKDLTQVARIMDGDGGNEPLKPVIQDELPFNETSLKEGFDKLKSRRAVGKIVFNMDMGIVLSNFGSFVNKVTKVVLWICLSIILTKPSFANKAHRAKDGKNNRWQHLPP